MESINKYLDERVSVTLTRRELYALRKYAKAQQSAASQGMMAAVKESRKRKRQEQYSFFSLMVDHLYGI